MKALKDKVALVTGGASGVGLETVKLLREAGAQVLFTDINVTAGTELVQQLGEGIFFMKQDVGLKSDWEATMAYIEQRFGTLQILINNAALLRPGNIETATLEDFQHIMQVNAASVFLGTQIGVRYMKDKGGSIVNMSSLSSWLPVDNYLAYSASKAAVAAISRTAALYCRKKGLPIRINSLHPDGIYTPMMQSTAPGVPAEYFLFNPRKNPKGRAVMPERIAQIIVFLASDASTAINGAEIRADSAILGMGL
jgi:3(or 17)beta-hydroxysteroid dehydrogenase